MYTSIVVWMCNWWRSDDISRESFCWQWGQSSLPCHCDSFSSKDRKYVRPDYSIWQPSCEKEPHEGKKKNLIYSLLVMDIILVTSYNPKITAKNWLKNELRKANMPKNPHDPSLICILIHILTYPWPIQFQSLYFCTNYSHIFGI